ETPTLRRNATCGGHERVARGRLEVHAEGGQSGFARLPSDGRHRADPPGATMALALVRGAGARALLDTLRRPQAHASLSRRGRAGRGVRARAATLRAHSHTDTRRRHLRRIPARVTGTMAETCVTRRPAFRRR